MAVANKAPNTKATPEKVVRPAALKTGVEVGLVMLMLELAAELEEAPAGAVGVTRRMEELLATQEVAGQMVLVTVTVAVTGRLELEDWPAETPGAEGETTGAEVPVMAGEEGPVMEGEPVTAGAVEPGMTVEETIAEVSVSQGVVEPGMTVEETIAEVSVSQGVVVAIAGVEEEMTVEETMAEVKVSQGVVEAAVELDPPSWQSTSPRTARHRLTGMLMRPPEEEELCWQWASPRTARQVLIGTLIREPSPLEEEAWSHLALPRAATQLLTGTLIKPLALVVCLHSTSPRMAGQRPTGTLKRLPVAWTPAARATKEVIIDCFILSKGGYNT
jgi:hypothetical protein